MALIILLLGLGVASATNDTSDNGIASTSTGHVEKTSVAKNVETQAVTKDITNNKNNITKKDVTTSNKKQEAKTIVLTNENYNNYVTESYFNDNVNDGDTIDIQGIIEKPATLNVNKKLNFITSTKDGVITGANTFRIERSASGSTVEGITFKNVQFSVVNARDVVINNISTLNEHKNIGFGIGSVSIREASENITVTNSYFKCEDNGGHSNVVFAIAYNCLFENNTVESYGGSVGNIFYLTTYNTDESIPLKHNVNITVRNNTIRGINVPRNLAICVGVQIEGYGHIIENNLIVKDGNLVGIQWTDPEYDMTTETGKIQFRNNTVIGNASCRLVFEGEVTDNLIDAPAILDSVTCINNVFNQVNITNNVTFYNNTVKNITISGSNNTITDIPTTIEIFDIKKSNNKISNVTINTDYDIGVAGDNNTITDSKIKSSKTYALNVTGNNNKIYNNNIEANVLKGNLAVKTVQQDNIIENNTPKTEATTIIITDEEYSNYFDENAKLIQVPNASIITFKGNFYNKDFIIDNFKGVIVNDNFTAYNSTLTFKENAQLSFDGEFKVNNVNSTKKNSIIIESSNVVFPEIRIYVDQTASDFVATWIKGNNNIVTSQLYAEKGTNNDANPSGIGVLIESSNNTIFSIFGISEKNFIATKFTATSSYNNLNLTGSPVLLSGNYNRINSYIYSDTKTALVLDNANNSYISADAIRTRTEEPAIIINNSNNNIIENFKQISAQYLDYAIIIVNNSNNNIIRNNTIINNKEYGGDNAVYTDQTSKNNTIIQNLNTLVYLNDQTYDDLFENNILKEGNYIEIDGDLHDKVMIFNYPVVVNGNNHTIYNSPITVNAIKTVIANITINATDIPNVLTINENTTINNMTIFHKFDNKNMNTITVNSSVLSLNNLEMNVYDYAENSDEEEVTIGILINNQGRLQLQNSNIKILSTKTDGSVIGICESGKADKDRPSEIRTTNIAIDSQSNVVALIGLYDIKDTNISVYGKDAYGIINNKDYVRSFNNVKININAKNNAIALLKNNPEYIKEDGYILQNVEINIESENTAIGVLANNTSLNIRSFTISLNAPEMIGLYLDNFQNEASGHTINLNGTNGIGIYYINSQIPSKIENNNINNYVEEGYLIVLKNINSTNILTNTMKNTNNAKGVLINNSSNIAIEKNTIENEEYYGDLAIEVIDSQNITISKNLPPLTLILTDDNYNQYFQDKTFIGDFGGIKLGSDLHNKDLYFTKDIVFDGNGYTVYNGTFSFTDITDITKLTNTRVYNTDERKTSINATGPITLFNNSITQLGDNKEIVILNMGDSKYNNVSYNKIVSEGNNNKLLNLNRFSINTEEDFFSFNILISTGDNCTAIKITTLPTKITYNNITMYANTPVTAINFEGSSLRSNFINDNIIITNTTQNNNPLIKATNMRRGSITNNYIESLDLVGDDAITTHSTTTKTGNYPTASSGYKAVINIEDVTLTLNIENVIKINVTDMRNNPIDGLLNVQINDEEIPIIDNIITYTPTKAGNFTLTATYNDPNGKYETTTETRNYEIPIPTSNVEIPTEVVLGESTELTASFYSEDGVAVNAGKAIFRVNGKTLRNNEGEVIYTDVVKGKAVMHDVNITNEWMKPDTTIQAVYVGDGNTDPIFTEKSRVNVTKPEAVISITSDLKATAGEKITLSVNVTDGGNNMNTGRVAFKLNGKTLKDENGKALYAYVTNGMANANYTIPAKTKAKTYNLTAVFTDTNYDRAEDAKDFRVYSV